MRRDAASASGFDAGVIMELKKKIKNFFGSILLLLLRKLSSRGNCQKVPLWSPFVT